MESENFKILWDFTVQCDRKIEARRPDIVFIDKKEREVVIIIDVAIPGDDRVKDKELEKVEKYQLLKVWHMRKVVAVSVVIGALGAVSVNFRKYMKQIGVKVNLEKQLSLTHLSTWDFSTLYTSLPHIQLKNQLHDLLERVFHTKGRSFIATNSFRTFWTTARMESVCTLRLGLNFLI